MKITPLDIYQKQFRRKTFNGLDPEEVEEFLFQVAEGVERLLQENAELHRRLEQLQSGPPPEAEVPESVEPEEEAAPAPAEVLAVEPITSSTEIEAQREELAALATQRAALMRELDQARQEANRVMLEAENNARRIVDEARAEAEHLLSVARSRLRRQGSDEAAVTIRARELAREYQAILVQHLAKITDYLGESEKAVGPVRPEIQVDEVDGAIESDDDGSTAPLKP